MNQIAGIVEIGSVATVTDYVANGSFESLRKNVNATDVPDYAVLVRLVDHNSQWTGPLRYVDQDSYEFLKKSRLHPGDVIVTNVGANAGTVFKVPDLGIPTTLGPNAVLCRPIDSSTLNREYLYYFLKSSIGQSRISAILGGSAQPKFNKTDFRRIGIAMPPLHEQNAIAEVLGALDDKIEANRRAAYISYELAIAAGSSICAHTSIDRVNLAAVTETTKGISYKSVDLVPGNGWLIGLKCAGRDGTFRYDGLKPYSGPFKPAQVVTTGDVLVAQTDLTQKAEVIGRPFRLPELSADGKLVASLDFAIVRPGPSLTAEVLMAILSSCGFRDHALSFCNGTTVLHMSSHALPSYEFDLPSERVVAEATAVMAPLFRSADQVNRETQALTKIRDTLLPKLLSGELRVRDVA